MTVIAETLPDPQPENPLALLQAVFGYQQFRPGQLEIIEQIVAGRDAWCSNPPAAASRFATRSRRCCVTRARVVVSPSSR